MSTLSTLFSSKLHNFMVPIKRDGKLFIEEIQAEDEHSAWVSLDKKFTDKLGHPLYESMGMPLKKETQ